MPFLPPDMVREIASYLDDESFKHWRQTCSFFARETFNDLVKHEKNKSAIKQVAMVYGGMLFLTYDATVWVCGNNHFGQLGLTDFNPCKELVQVHDLTAVAQLSAGTYHTLFLKKDGTVWGCGNNQHGELGLGLQHAPFPQLTEVTQVTAGTYQSAFLKKDGTVWMCGSNEYGKSGLGNPNQHYHTPTQIPDFNDIAQVSLGTHHTLFLKKDGTVWGCGNNSYGQLGLGSKKKCITPVPIPGLTEIVQVTAGNYHSLFLKKDGSVWVCGLNYHGALGLGDYNDRYTPTQIPTVSEITQIFADKGPNSVLQKKDGSVLGCGSNYYGELGLGNSGQLNIPTQIPGLMHVKQVAFDTMALFLKKDGNVLVGGLNWRKKLESKDYDLHPFPQTLPKKLTQIQTLEAYHAEAKYMRKSF